MIPKQLRKKKKILVFMWLQTNIGKTKNNEDNTRL